MAPEKIRTLRTNGLRGTQQRQAILEELCKVCCHPTAEWIHRRVRRRLPNVSLATVYRNLDDLARRGIILKLKGSDGQAHFDGCADEHYHVHCTACDRIEDVPLPPLASLQRACKKITGYRISGINLEFHGVCAACRRRRS